MSIEVMTLVWKHYPVGGSELLLALALADIGQDDGSRIHPSVQFMAHKTRMSERNIQYLLAKMLKRSILKMVRKGGIASGNNYTTRYLIDISALTGSILDRVQSLHPGVQPVSPRGANQRIPRVKPVAPNPLVVNLSISKPNPSQRFALPGWIPSESWKGFEAMRRKIRKPLTDRTKAMIVAKLEELRAEGQDPVAVLAQSEVNSWAGIFPVRSNGRRSRSSQQEAIAAWKPPKDDHAK